MSGGLAFIFPKGSWRRNKEGNGWGFEDGGSRSVRKSFLCLAVAARPGNVDPIQGADHMAAGAFSWVTWLCTRQSRSHVKPFVYR